MSTEYRPLTPIMMVDLFDGRLEPFGIREQIVEGETTEQCRGLTDGANFLCVYGNDSGRVDVLKRYQILNNPRGILSAIVEVFDVEIVSEYDPQFWGFDTQEEWDAWQNDLARRHEEEFYKELLKFLAGQPNDIEPGTVGMIQAEIARTLVDRSPELISPENRAALMGEVEAIYDRDHAVKISLDDRDIAAVRAIIEGTDTKSH